MFSTNGKNPCNPDVHYNHTSQEILDDFGTDLHMVVMGVGTGGTITGVGRRLKESIPDIKIIGADPYGSILGGEDEYKGSPYHVEGIGYDFFPKTFDPTVVDRFVKVNDKEAFSAARTLINRRRSINRRFMRLCNVCSPRGSKRAQKRAKLLDNTT